MTRVCIDFSQDEFAAMCGRHGVRRVAFFGSVLRDDFGADSDIDMLVEFEPQAQPGFEIVAIQLKYCRRVVKDEVLAAAEGIYAA